LAVKLLFFCSKYAHCMCHYWSFLWYSNG